MADDDGVDKPVTDLAEGVDDVSPDSSTGDTGAAQFERRWTKRTGRSAPSDIPAPATQADSPAKIDKERARADDLYERLQRSMADLSNYRKRAEAEREEMMKFASMLLVAELLPVLDNFERALESIPRELEGFSWLQGVALIERHLRAILDRQGVEAITAKGTPFNPSLHEAILEEESTEYEAGTVIGELQRGYTMHGRVLRPTLAKVSKAAGVTPPEGNGPIVGEPALANAEDGSRENHDVTAE